MCAGVYAGVRRCVCVCVQTWLLVWAAEGASKTRVIRVVRVIRVKRFIRLIRVIRVFRVIGLGL
jgi:hypothetical protein